MGENPRASYLPLRIPRPPLPHPTSCYRAPWGCKTRGRLVRKNTIGFSRRTSHELEPKSQNETSHESELVRKQLPATRIEQNRTAGFLSYTEICLLRCANFRLYRNTLPSLLTSIYRKTWAAFGFLETPGTSVPPGTLRDPQGTLEVPRGPRGTLGTPRSVYK